jgi:hypothetical protein
MDKKNHNGRDNDRCMLHELAVCHRGKSPLKVMRRHVKSPIPGQYFFWSLIIGTRLGLEAKVHRDLRAKSERVAVFILISV